MDWASMDEKLTSRAQAFLRMRDWLGVYYGALNPHATEIDLMSTVHLRYGGGVEMRVEGPDARVVRVYMYETHVVGYMGYAGQRGKETSEGADHETVLKEVSQYLTGEIVTYV